MATKKSKKTQKKVVKTKRVLKPKPLKKTTEKKKTIKKVAKTSGKTTKTKKVSPNIPKTKTKKKEVKKGPAVKAVKKEKVAPKAPEVKAKGKLTPREKKIKEIKKKLIMQRNALLSEAEEALNILPGQTIFPDMGDQASAEIDRSFMLRLRGREQRLLKKIEAALDKIDNGSFGICEACGEEIDIKRLDARPVTTMCIHCKTEQEEEEKLRGA